MDQGGCRIQLSGELNRRRSHRTDCQERYQYSISHHDLARTHPGTNAGGAVSLHGFTAQWADDRQFAEKSL
jgi:hypothetical protein